MFFLHVFRQLVKTMNYAESSDMNFKKTTAMVCNPCSSIDFSPELTLGGIDIQVVDEIRLLGIIIQSDLKWT